MASCDSCSHREGESLFLGGGGILLPRKGGPRGPRRCLRPSQRPSRRPARGAGRVAGREREQGDSGGLGSPLTGKSPSVSDPQFPGCGVKNPKNPHSSVTSRSPRLWSSAEAPATTCGAPAAACCLSPGCPPAAPRHRGPAVLGGRPEAGQLELQLEFRPQLCLSLPRYLTF